MSYTIKQVTSEEEMELVGKLRFKVYVEEMGRNQKHADYLRGTILEPYDRGAIVLAAFENGKCIGTIRGNCSDVSYVGDYPEFYRMGFLGASHPIGTSFVTKLIVDPEYRNSTLTVRLVQEMYRHLVLAGSLFIFIDTNDHLVNMYSRLGFVPYMGKVHHEEYGDVLPMILVTADEEHLQSVKSPLYRVAAEISRDLGYNFYQNPRSQESVRSFRSSLKRLERPACAQSCKSASCPMANLVRQVRQASLALNMAS